MAGFLLATVELCLAAHLALKLMKHLFRAAWHYSYNTFHLSLTYTQMDGDLVAGYTQCQCRSG